MTNLVNAMLESVGMPYELVGGSYLNSKFLS
jgi:hypothetical protein